jgi:hypothetical protein
MSDCCVVTEESRNRPQVERINTAVCPSCSQKGKSVDSQTVKAMLAVSLETLAESSRYRFCRTPDCPVVYFDAQDRFFTEAHLRERVHQKHPEAADVFVCYCYRHTPGSIRAEMVERGETDVVARITAGTKAGTCACDIRNPQGSCCLGNVSKVVKLITAEMILLPAR